MKIRLLAALLVFASLQGAHAQNGNAPVAEPAPSRPASYPAALRIVTVALPDGPTLPQGVVVVSSKLPEDAVGMLQDWAAGRPHGADVAAKLRAYEATMPRVIDEILLEALPSIRRSAAMELSQVYSVEEAEGIAAFSETEAGREFWRLTFGAGAANKNADGSISSKAAANAIEEMSLETFLATDRFQDSPAGKAFKREVQTMNGLIARAVSSAIGRPLQMRLRADVCRDIAPSWCR